VGICSYLDQRSEILGLRGVAWEGAQVLRLFHDSFVVRLNRPLLQILKYFSGVVEARVVCSRARVLGYEVSVRLFDFLFVRLDLLYVRKALVDLPPEVEVVSVLLV